MHLARTAVFLALLRVSTLRRRIKQIVLSSILYYAEGARLIPLANVARHAMPCKCHNRHRTEAN